MPVFADRRDIANLAYSLPGTEGSNPSLSAKTNRNNVPAGRKWSDVRLSFRGRDFLAVIATSGFLVCPQAAEPAHRRAPPSMRCQLPSLGTCC